MKNLIPVELNVVETIMSRANKIHDRFYYLLDDENFEKNQHTEEEILKKEFLLEFFDFITKKEFDLFKIKDMYLSGNSGTENNSFNEYEQRIFDDVVNLNEDAYFTRSDIVTLRGFFSKFDREQNVLAMKDYRLKKDLLLQFLLLSKIEFIRVVAERTGMSFTHRAALYEWLNGNKEDIVSFLSAE